MTNEESVIRWQLSTDRRVRNEAFKAILKNNRGLIMKTCYSMIEHSQIDFRDFEQSSALYIKESMDKFDIKLGWKFSSFMVWYLRKSASYFRKTVSLVKKPIIYVWKPSDRPIPTEPLSRNEKIKDGRLYTRRHHLDTTRHISLNTPIYDDSPTTALDLLKEDPQRYSDEAGSVKTLLKILRHHERFILIKSYGLGQAGPQTLDHIGEQIGLTRERVRQIKYMAMKKLEGMIEFKAMAGDGLCREIKEMYGNPHPER